MKLLEEDENTKIGKHVAVFVENVTVVFNEVTSTGMTTVKELEDGPEGPNGAEILRYYKIKTTAEYDGPVKIRLILPCDVPASELWKWLGEGKGWKNITKTYNSKYHFIVGKEMRRLSIFGVT